MRAAKTVEVSRTAEFTDPEIRRSSLAGVILQMETLQLPAIDEFPFLEPPSRALIREGYQTLVEIGAMDDAHQLTPLGREIGLFPHTLKLVLQLLDPLRLLGQAAIPVRRGRRKAKADEPVRHQSQDDQDVDPCQHHESHAAR